jgi:murein DD-endopeptidase MepM/ murein hydrolase activator NlpD
MKPLPHKYTVFLTLSLFGILFFAPHISNAGMMDTFLSKVKITFFTSADKEEGLSESIKKSAILSPTLLASAEETGDSSNTVLEVKNGPMRLSTEEIDYPLEDTITVYEVKDGDTLSSVAKLFGVTVDTILWANDISSKKIKSGDVLVILPVTGVKYVAKEGDTLAKLAKKYKGDVSEIAKFNGIAEDASLALGQEIIIPDGEVEAEKPKQAPGSIAKIPRKLFTAPLGFFVKPLAWFIKTQGIHGKNGVDLAAKVGAPIVATAAGKVIVSKPAGYNGGYGSMIVIAHKNNIQTLYAHLSQVYVQTGVTVEQGQVIGALGSTGRSSGPHLHIEVRGAANPF